jgi:hypothetical protein
VSRIHNRGALLELANDALGDIAIQSSRPSALLPAEHALLVGRRAAELWLTRQFSVNEIERMAPFRQT